MLSFTVSVIFWNVNVILNPSLSIIITSFFFFFFESCKLKKLKLIIYLSTGLAPVPFNVAYNMSKAAVASFTEGLRMELRTFNIHAATIIPSGYKTGKNTKFTNRIISFHTADKKVLFLLVTLLCPQTRRSRPQYHITFSSLFAMTKLKTRAQDV